MTTGPEKRIAQTNIDQNFKPKKIKGEVSPKKEITQKEDLKLVSWNVGGINACLKKGFLEKVKILEADILLLQETKLQTPSEFVSRSLYPYQYQSVSKSKKGYSGSALLSKVKPIKVEYSVGKDSLDDEGRYVVAEFEDFFLVAAYIPNAGAKLERLDVKRKHHKEVLAPFLEGLLQKKALIFAGDLNVAHKEIDLARPKTNHKTAGFTPGERQDFSELIESLNLHDTYRMLHPDVTDKYTYYSYRFDCYKKNIGWRLDYFLVSNALKDQVVETDIHTEMHGASDHVPLTLKILKKLKV